MGRNAWAEGPLVAQEAKGQRGGVPLRSGSVGRAPRAAGGRQGEPSLSHQVVDADSLLRPLPRVQALTVSRVCWQPATSEEEEEGGAPARLRLSCTLHWSYLLSPIRCFRIHCLPGSGGGSPRGGPPGPDKPVLLGLAFVNQYRVVELPVVAAGPGRDGRVQFLVEPVPKEGFLVPQAEWGRAALLYSLPQL